MIKRVWVFCFLFLFSMMSITFVSPAVSDCAEGDQDCLIDEAYSCLNDNIDEKGCNALGAEEKVFSLLATGECRSETIEESEYKSDVAFTAKTLVALKESGSGASDAEDWLLDNNHSTVGIDWFLEIESPGATTCSVGYSSSNTVTINEDKTIDSVTGGSCLSISNNGYWVEVDSDCFDEEFTISCEDQFLTTLIYKDEEKDTIYVSENANSASSGGETTEKVRSLCFSTSSNSCDYEGTLWSAFALSISGGDVTSYLPYLITMASENEELLPEAFLYLMTGSTEFKNQVLSKQVNNKWWISKDDRFYGTAVALLPFQFEEPLQKKDSLNWLFNEAQNEDGCWDSGNIRNNAFLLYSISPQETSSGSSGGSCVGAGYDCVSQIQCSGDILPGFACSGSFVCCTEPVQALTCVEQGGEICNSNQVCTGTGSLGVDASDTSSGQVCCVQGTCQESQTQQLSECEMAGGNCRINSCLSGEESSSLACDFSSDVCCVQQTESQTSYLWIWILLILIILVVIGIIFRDKLRPYWIRTKSWFDDFKGKIFKKKSPPGPRPGTSQSPPGQMPSRPRPYFPKNRRPARVPRPKSQSEIDEVLKKLKDIGK